MTLDTSVKIAKWKANYQRMKLITYSGDFVSDYDKDKESFEAWLDEQSIHNTWKRILCEGAWRAACEYKDKALINGTRMKQMNEEIERLKAENAKLRECVEFYADEKSWNKRSISTGYSYSPQYMSIGINDDAYLHEVSKDGAGYSGDWYKNSGYVGGKRARQVLKELEEK